MSGVKGKGGAPLGNLNNVQNPWRSFWRRQALREWDQWLEYFLTWYGDALRSDKPDPTSTEERLIELASVARGALLLTIAELARRGFVEENEAGWRLHPG